MNPQSEIPNPQFDVGTDGNSYLWRATKEQQQILRQQWDDIHNHNHLRCPCGQLRALTNSFRCLYCGIWFCQPCAELHFGQSVESWVLQKRIAARNEAFAHFSLDYQI